MRSKLLVGMVLAVAVFSLAGCGVKEKKEMKTKKVSANTGRTLEERREAKFKADIEGCEMALSKNCLYTSDTYLSNSGYITQWNRTGEKVSSTRKEGYEVDGCSDKRLICSKDIETAAGKEIVEIYSIPIKQTESGERVQWEKEEKVASSVISAKVFLCEPYLIYAGDKNTLMRLNLETKEKKTMKIDILSAWFNNSCIMDDLLYLVEEQSDEERVYCIRIDDWTSEKLYENKTEGEIDNICIDGQSLYMVTCVGDGQDGKIIDFDMEKRKVMGQLSFEKIDTLLQKEGVSTSYIDENDIDLYIYEGRLYISVTNIYIESKTREEYDRWALVSCSKEGMTELKYEREVSEWYCENSAAESNKGKIVYYGAYFCRAYEDEFYFAYTDKQEKKDRLMRYHLDTKKWEEVPENELVYRVAKEMEYIEE